MLTFSVLALGVKEIRLCDDTDFDVDCSFNLRILSVDLNYKKHIVSLSVNNSCHDTKKKSIPVLIFELRISLSLYYVLYLYVAGVFCGLRNLSQTLGQAG